MHTMKVISSLRLFYAIKKHGRGGVEDPDEEASRKKEFGELLDQY